MITSFNKFVSAFLVFLISIYSFFVGGYNDSDIKTITDNIVNGMLAGKIETFSSSDIKEGDKIVSSIALDEDGDSYFPDIDYTSTERAFWVPSRHIARAERLALLYRLENDSDKKAEYRDCVFGLINYWIKNDFQSDNWWHNRLSNPNILGEICLLMKDDLSRKQINKLAEYVGRGSFTISRETNNFTGANAIDLAMSTIKFGAITGSRYAVSKAVRVVSNELKISKDEGLKNDGTFFQHGNRLYMGGYGITFINGMTTILSMLSGTEYMFSEQQLIPFTNFILDGLRIMSFGSTLDPTTMGRSVSRINSQPLKNTASVLERLLNIEEMPRKDEIKAYVDSIKNDTKNDYGVKYFDTAKFVVINNNDFYFSFRGGDNKFVYSEIINDENILSYNSSFPGVTTIMCTGREYNNISPIYDYSFVPGTTAVRETDEELKAHEDYTYRNLDGIYSGVYTNGVAVSSAQTMHEGISMTISCFATDNSAILLGTGMNDSQGRKMNTTIDQSFYVGTFTRNGNTIIHNGIKYTVLDGGTISAGYEHRIGNWHRNNLSIADNKVEGDIFTISIENTGSYAYTVMSENTEADFEVIVNNEKVQAVKLPDGRIAASFFEKGNFNYSGKEYSGKAGESKIFSD